MTNRRLWAIAPRLFGDTELHDLEVVEPDSASAFRRMWEDYACGMLDDAPTRQVGEDGKRAVEIVQAAYQSNQTSRVVDLPLS
jgi:predicted dehydrogenase